MTTVASEDVVGHTTHIPEPMRLVAAGNVLECEEMGISRDGKAKNPVNLR